MTLCIRGVALFYADYYDVNEIMFVKMFSKSQEMFFYEIRYIF